MHHLEHGNATKFIQVLLTAFVSVPTLLTIFTIAVFAGNRPVGRSGAALSVDWERPMVLATELGFVMLGFGRIRWHRRYGLRHECNGAQHLLGHSGPFCIVIFGGSVVIIYFAIAYEIWPRLTRHVTLCARLRLQLWLWFIGMMVMTLPWHWLDSGPVAARCEFQLRQIQKSTSPHRVRGRGLVHRRHHLAPVAILS